MRALGATISGVHHRGSLRSETEWAEFVYFLCYFKMGAPRTLVFRLLVKGNEDSGNEIGIPDETKSIDKLYPMHSNCEAHFN